MEGELLPKTSCGLLSFCTFGILFLTTRSAKHTTWRLWFAFILYFWDIIFNCFLKNAVALFGCGLLSFCTFGILFLTGIRNYIYARQLWFAFILYFWDIIFNQLNAHGTVRTVVVCFHFVLLGYYF